MLLRWLDDTQALAERECCEYGMGGYSEKYCGFFGCTPDGCPGHEIDCQCDQAEINKLIARLEGELKMSRPHWWRPWREQMRSTLRKTFKFELRNR